MKTITNKIYEGFFKNVGASMSETELQLRQMGYQEVGKVNNMPTMYKCIKGKHTIDGIYTAYSYDSDDFHVSLTDPEIYISYSNLYQRVILYIRCTKVQGYANEPLFALLLSASDNYWTGGSFSNWIKYLFFTFDADNNSNLTDLSKNNISKVFSDSSREMDIMSKSPSISDFSMVDIKGKLKDELQEIFKLKPNYKL